jgi:hypothetical protein
MLNRYMMPGPLRRLFEKPWPPGEVAPIDRRRSQRTRHSGGARGPAGSPDSGDASALELMLWAARAPVHSKMRERCAAYFTENRAARLTIGCEP